MNAMGEVSTGDPFILLFERWTRINDFLKRVMDEEKSHTSDSPHISEAYDAKRALELQMADTTPTTVEGLRGLIEVTFDILGPDFLPGTARWAEQMDTLEMRLFCQARASARELTEAK